MTVDTKYWSKGRNSVPVIFHGPGNREWLLGAMAVPIQVAADAALDCLSWSMTRTTASGPDELLARLERSNCGKEFGRQ